MQPLGTCEEEFHKRFAFYGIREGAGLMPIDQTAGIVSALSLSSDTETDSVEKVRRTLVTAYRSVATTGAKPLGVVVVLAELGDAADEIDEELSDACVQLSLEVAGVTFIAEGQQDLVSAAVNAIAADVTQITPTDLQDDGDVIYLLGGRFDDGAVDLGHERKLAEIMVAAHRDGLLNAALDVGDGGVAIALASMAIRGRKGARFWVPEQLDAYEFLFENCGGILCVVPRTEELRFSDMCNARYMPLDRIGVVDGTVLELQGEFTFPVST